MKNVFCTFILAAVLGISACSGCAPQGHNYGESSSESFPHGWHKVGSGHTTMPAGDCQVGERQEEHGVIRVITSCEQRDDPSGHGCWVNGTTGERVCGNREDTPRPSD